MGDPAQIPLSLRWEHRPHWKALQAEFGGTETTAAMILSLVTADGTVSYSRNRNHYVVPARYRSGLYTLARIVGSADYLDGQRLITHDRVRPGNLGWQSSMSARPELLERANRIIAAGPPLVPARPVEPVILRGADKNRQDYRDTAATRRMRRNIEQFNEAIRGTLLTGVLPCSMVRIFNRTFQRGGRFYAQGGGWQSMSKEARKQITIGGEPVVEIDYKTLHPAILYAQTGAPLPEDSYDIDGWPRDLVKVGLLILVNAKTMQEARFAIAHHDAMKSTSVPGSQEAFRAADALMAEVKRVHRPIAWSFHSDKGAELMALDSQMAETVMHIMMMAGIMVLPVHDSFLVQKSKAGLLEEAMQRAAYETGLEAVQIAVS